VILIAYSVHKLATFALKNTPDMTLIDGATWERRVSTILRHLS